jgi:hypothetical protein
MTELRLRKFKPQCIDPCRVLVFLGKRYTGKSFLMNDIIYHNRNKFASGLVMSPTEESNEGYKDKVPEMFIYNDVNYDALVKIVEKQREFREKLKDKCPYAFIILDDCMYDKKLMKQDIMRQLFMNGRHYHIFLCITAQYMMDFPPEMRTNVDYVFVLRENIHGNQERIWKNFFGIFPRFEQFKTVMNQCTENFGCLVLDQTARSNKIEDCVFWYKAEKRNQYRLGCAAYWDYATKHFVKKKMKRQEDDIKSSQQQKVSDRRMKVIKEDLAKKKVVKHSSRHPSKLQSSRHPSKPKI